MEPLSRAAFSLAIGIAGPACAVEPVPLADYLAGRIQNDAVVEASGIACHEAGKGRVWILNDSGWEPVVYAVGLDGSDADSIRTTAPNDDWEDMTFIDDGDATDIVIGDIGDNAADRDWVSLYRLHGKSGAVSELRFTYPEGPRDAESVVIDSRDGKAYVLAKRTLPAELYAVPIDRWNNAAPVVADFVGPVGSLPEPSYTDRLLAHARRNWHWQSTAMDVSPDGSRVAILTYAAVYLYPRRDGMTLAESLEAAPVVFELQGLPLAESLCLTGREVILTTEGRHPALYRIPYTDPGWTPGPSNP